MKPAFGFVSLFCCVALTACATTPPVTLSYLPARTTMAVKVVQSLACTKEFIPVSSYTQSQEVAHFADWEAEPHRVTIEGLDSEFSNAKVKMELYPDGRLKGFNAESTGQGGAIVKSAISLVTKFAADTDKGSYKALCQKLKKQFGKEPMSLTMIHYEGSFADNDQRAFNPAPDSRNNYEIYGKLAGQVCFATGTAKQLRPADGSGLSKSRHIFLTAKQPGLVPVSITAGRGGACNTELLWSGLVAVGQRGSEMAIPIPKAAAFGKQEFAVAFEGSGALSSIAYGKESGASAGIDAASEVLGLFKADTDGERAKKLNEEIDLIKAQQRLVKCRAAPESCT